MTRSSNRWFCNNRSSEHFSGALDFFFSKPSNPTWFLRLHLALQTCSQVLRLLVSISSLINDYTRLKYLGSIKRAVCHQSRIRVHTRELNSNVSGSSGGPLVSANRVWGACSSLVSVDVASFQVVFQESSLSGS